MKSIEVEGFAHRGVGIGRIDNKIVFIENSLPGEIVDIEIKENKKDYCMAETVNILKPSAYRINPVCPYYGVCGGCDMQHVDYKYQLELKKSVLKNILKRIASLDKYNIETAASDEIFNYRRRVRFRCSGSNWGFFKRKSSKIVSIKECFTADKRINSYINSEQCSAFEIEVSDDDKVNPKVLKLDLSSIKKNLYLTYKPGVFTQINRSINLKIIETLLSRIDREDINSVFDFFGGMGNFSIPIAIKGISVTGFELDKKAVDSFKKNVRRLNLDRKAFVVRKNLNRPFAIEQKCAECVILDPPRAGAKSVIKYIVENRPKFVFYVSCEPSTLARDLKILKDYYKIKLIKLFDMFPQTHHFETFAELEIIKKLH